MIHNYYQHWRRFNNRINHNYYRKLARFFWITSFNNSTFCSRDTLFFFRMSFSFSSSLILWQSTVVSFSFCDFRYDQLDNCCIKDYNQLPTLHIQRKMEFDLSLTIENLENSWIFALNFFKLPSVSYGSSSRLSSWLYSQGVGDALNLSTKSSSDSPSSASPSGSPVGLST